VLNSDSAFYGGSNLGNGLADLETIEGEWMGRPWSLVINVPPLAGIVLRPAPQPQPQEESDEEAAPEE
jgi:1,4-alpha-glucan branching enzyme